ncbi:uncharacterized protein LOC143612158 [Bidens hawaiensis]|uniref:uncharacterized protein LOC143612158 n=1 Tax=Bidens hawaiensis TaxID=980011 RepID=UPI0040495E88
MNLLSLNVRGIGSVGKPAWVKKLVSNHKVDVLGLQESMLADVGNFDIASVWGNGGFEADIVGARGKSGGLITLWNNRKFKKVSSIKEQHFLLVSGNLIEDGSLVNIVNVFAPQKVGEKRVLWDSLLGLMQGKLGMWIFFEDFNSVRWVEERKKSKFNVRAAHDFNNFINEACLQEFNMQGNKFTYLTSIGDSIKMSKIDRFLVCQDFFNRWHGACLRALNRELSDHNPILLTVVDTNYGPKPFKWFDSWLDRDDCFDVVKNALSNAYYEGPADISLFKKLAEVKRELKNWWKCVSTKEGEEISRL